MGCNYFLYYHVRPDIEQVFYVGIGSHQRKWKHARTYTKASRNIHWRRIVEKCNGEFIVKIFYDNLTKEQAIEAECMFIEIFGRSDLGIGSLCNLTKGGEGVFELSISSRLKISKAMTGKNNHQYGKKHSEQWRKDMSEKMKGENNHNYGKPLSDYQKEINRNAQKGRQKTQEEKNKIYSKTRKKVSDSLGNVFDSLTDAAVYYKVSLSTINRWIKIIKMV